MNAIVLGIPILLIRYVYLGMINKAALAKASFFPPTVGREKVAFYVYQVTTLILLFYLLFARLNLSSVLNYIGYLIFLAGLVLYAISIRDFAKPRTDGLNRNGLYGYSRNPMYVAFFVYFLGCSLIINSWFYFATLILFQVSVHYLILSEERWCRQEFGKEYSDYMNDVRRYI